MKKVANSFLTILLFLSFPVVTTTPASASMNCAVLKKMTSNLFKGTATREPSTENVWKEAGAAFNKAMNLAFTNQGCYKKSEIAGMKKAIKDLRIQCDKARSDETLWWLLKDMCHAYSPSFKYGK